MAVRNVNRFQIWIDWVYYDLCERAIQIKIFDFRIQYGESQFRKLLGFQMNMGVL